MTAPFLRCFCRLTEVFVIFTLLFIVSTGYSQTEPKRVHSVFAEDEPLKSVLGRLSLDEGVNLTYNATDPNLDTRISFSGSNLTLEEILSGLLQKTNHEFRKVGNHMVIFPAIKTSENLPQTQSTGAAPSPDQLQEIPDESSYSITDNMLKPDGVLDARIDTVRIFETITRTDTLIIRDTVFIDREVPGKRKTQGISNLKDVFRFEPDRQDGLALSFSYAQLFSWYSFEEATIPEENHRKMKDSETPSFRNYSLGSSLQMNKGKFSIAAGVFLSGFANRFSYQQTTSKGGFYEPDTLDIFYTLQQNDTIWTYVTDSSYIPVDKQEISYDRSNRMGFIEVRLSGGFTVYADESKAFYLKAGLGLGHPVWAGGSTFQNSAGYPVVERERDMFNQWIMDYQAGAGFKYRTGNWTDLFAEIYYKRNQDDVLNNYPVSSRLNGMAVNVGLLYYF
jgi:hypothetical protein